MGFKRGDDGGEWGISAERLLVKTEDLSGFNEVIKKMSEELAAITEQTQLQMIQRFKNLTNRRAALKQEISGYESFVEDEVATSKVKLRMYLASHELYRLELDIEDTRDAMVRLELGEYVPVGLKFEDGGGLSELDNREAHQ